MTNYQYLLSQLFCIFGYLFLFSLIIYYFLNAEFRKGSLKTIRTHYQESFTTETLPLETFKAITQYAIQSGYRIDDFDEQNLSLILNEKMSFSSYGSIYAIYVREQAGKTLVRVGINSKLGRVFLISPINKMAVKLRLERMLNGVKSAVFAFNNMN
jgi:hypothetical protein